MLTTVRYVLFTAMRDWLFVGILAAQLLILGASLFLGGTTLVEQKEAMLVYMGGASRIVLALGLIIFICFHLRSAFENKDIDLLLSRPLGRVSILMAYFLGFSVIALILVLVSMGLSAAIIGWITMHGWMAFFASLLCESLLVVAMSLFFGFVMHSATFAVMTSLGFYALARLVGFFLLSANAPSMLAVPIIGAWVKPSVTAFSWLIPRLDFFGESHWLLYGAAPGEIQTFVIQTLCYVPLLLCAASLDFRRKQF